MAILEEADIVYNHPKSGAIISNKRSANEALSKVGCLVPRSADVLNSEDTVFSNAMEESGAFAFTAKKQSGLDSSRHNTEFVDTRVLHAGVEYFTTVRLMCINNIITHQFTRARPSSEGNPSVHAKDTPRDADLVNALHHEVCKTAGAQFQKIANQIFDAFGPGFYSHDVLVDRSDGRVFVCETGYKFDDMAYQGHMREIARQIDGLEGFEDAEATALASADVLANEIWAQVGKAQI